MMPNLDLDLLRALIAIADKGSFSRAAEQLGRSQSAVSLQIQRLEALTGRALLQRSQGKVIGPTDDGRLLLAYARQMLSLNDEAYQSLGGTPLVGELRIGMPEEWMEGVFPAALQRFRIRHPHMQLSVLSGISSLMVEALAAGRLDVAVVKETTQSADDDADTIWREPLAWMVAESYPPGWPETLPLAVFGETCAFRLAATAALGKAGRNWRVAYSGGSMASLRHAVRCGLGVTVLPRSLRIEGLSVVSAGLPPLPDARLQARYAEGTRHPAVQHWVDLLKESARDG